MKSHFKALLAAIALAGLPSVSAMAQQATVMQPGNIVATVLDVDVDSRRVLLRDDGGAVFAVVANEAVGGLDKVKAGDLVQVATLEITTVSMAKADDVEVGADMVIFGERDKLPARDDVTATRRIVEVLKVTPDGTEVTWRDKNVQGPHYAGATTTVITDQKLKAFAQTLTPGDDVVVDTVHKVSVSVIPK